MLRLAILQGKITKDSDHKGIYDGNPEHKKWKWENWKKNLWTLLNAVARDSGRMEHNILSYGHDLAIVKAMRDKEAEEVWHRSPAYRLLKQDVDDNKHKQLAPKDLWVTRPEYLKFDLKCFRKHIYQEVDSRPKRAIRFEKKKKKWLYPELHKDHPRLDDSNDDSDDDSDDSM